MLEKLTADSGHEILRLNGQLLCSKVDPISEAKRYLSRYDFTNTKSVIFFGLGCGYKVVELIQEKPHLEILVLEPNANVIEQVEKIHGLKLARVNIMQIKSSYQVLGSIRVKEALKKPYQILTSEVSFKLYPDIFDQELYNYLLGRTKKGAEFIAEARGMQFGLQPGVDSQLLSIKDIDGDTLSDLKRKELDILRELVK